MAVEELLHLTGGCTIGNMTDCVMYACRISCQFVCDIKQFLDSHCPDLWIGWVRLDLWTLRSLYLTAADLYLWDRMKGIVYSYRMGKLDELWHLVEAVATVVQHVHGIFQHTRNSWFNGAQLWIQTNGEYFQQLSKCFVNITMLFKPDK